MLKLLPLLGDSETATLYDPFESLFCYKELLCPLFSALYIYTIIPSLITWRNELKLSMVCRCHNSELHSSLLARIELPTKSNPCFLVRGCPSYSVYVGEGFIVIRIGFLLQVSFAMPTLIVSCLPNFGQRHSSTQAPIYKRLTATRLLVRCQHILRLAIFDHSKKASSLLLHNSSSIPTTTAFLGMLKI